MTQLERQARRERMHAHKEIVDTLKSFEKRSKFITVKSVHTFYGLIGVVVEATKDNSIKQELVNYLNSLCTIVENDNNDTWYYSANRYNDNADLEEVQIEILLKK